ncbi:MAG: SPOR domain-containing protein [Bacteroidales bacterium]|nr:SPOR domain-containing protein [Bacteroidales bacterium]
MTRKILFFIILFTVGIFSTTYSQKYNSNYKRFFNNWSANVNIGANQFYGDISNKNLYDKINEETKLSYGFILTKDLSPYFAIRGQILNGKLYSTKDKYNNGAPANLCFDADVFEYNISGVLNISNLIWRNNLYKKFSVYGVLGFGFSNWKTTLKNSLTGNVISTHGFCGSGPNKRTTEIVGPLGLGINYNIGNNISLNIESTLRTVNSDFLDAAKGGFSYDFYSYTSLGFTYKFNNSYRSSTKKFKNTPIGRKVIKRKSPKEEESINKKNKKREAREKRREDRKNKKKKKNIEIEPPELLEFPDVNKVYPKDIKKVKKIKKIEEPSNNIKVVPEDESVYNEGKLIITGNTKNIINKNKGKTLVEKPKNTSSYVYDVQKIQGVVFRIQIMASKKRMNFKKVLSENNIKENGYVDYSHGWYRYSVGNFPSYNKAKRYCDILYNKGFIDAFVVAYSNGKKVPLNVFK